MNGKVAISSEHELFPQLLTEKETGFIAAYRVKVIKQVNDAKKLTGKVANAQFAAVRRRSL